MDLAIDQPDAATRRAAARSPRTRSSMHRAHARTSTRRRTPRRATRRTARRPARRPATPRSSARSRARAAACTRRPSRGSATCRSGPGRGDSRATLRAPRANAVSIASRYGLRLICLRRLRWIDEIARRHHHPRIGRVPQDRQVLRVPGEDALACIRASSRSGRRSPPSARRPSSARWTGGNTRRSSSRKTGMTVSVPRRAFQRRRRRNTISAGARAPPSRCGHPRCSRPRRHHRCRWCHPSRCSCPDRRSESR